MTLLERHWILQKQLDEISKNLGEARVDKHEDANRRKKQDIVENLKRHYKGVYDRIISMCHPIHQRYNIAVTKILGKYMEAIVVDTGETARHCIQYLKEHMLDPETFLPLDYLKVSFSFINRFFSPLHFIVNLPIVIVGRLMIGQFFFWLYFDKKSIFCQNCAFLRSKFQYSW